MKITFLFCFSQLLLCVSLFAQENEMLMDKYINHFQYQEALNEIQKLPETKEILEKKLFCFKQLNDYNAAIKVSQMLTSEYPEDLAYKVDLATCYEMAGNYKKSLGCFDDLIMKDSTNIYYKLRRADLFEKQDKYSAALTEYNILMKNNESNNMLRKVANCYSRLNKVDSASVYYEKAWAKDSSDFLSVASLVSLNLKQGKPGIQKAMHLSDLYIQKDFTSNPINVLNALSYYAADEYEEAINRFEKCYNEGDSSLLVLRSLGISYYSLGQRDVAYDYLQRAYDLDTTNINVLFALGVTANDKMNYDLGGRCFQSLLDRVQPSDFTLYQYYRNLGIAKEGEKNYLSAVDAYENAVKYANENQRMHLYYTIVCIYDVDLKMPDKALDFYNLYKESLSSYYSRLLKAENRDEKEIEITKTKLEALDKHIKRLSEQLGLASNNNGKIKVESTIELNF